MDGNRDVYFFSRTLTDHCTILLLTQQGKMKRHDISNRQRSKHVCISKPHYNFDRLFLIYYSKSVSIEMISLNLQCNTCLR